MHMEEVLQAEVDGNWEDADGRPLATLKLTGAENQELRRTVRRCRSAFVAINGCGLPLIDLLLPHLRTWPALLHGLLALASRETQHAVRSIEHYQRAIAELRTAAQWTNAESDTERTLAAALLLTFFDFPGAEWQQHLRAMLAIIHAADDTLLTQKPLMRLAVGSFAHLDISCYSLGRSDRSSKLWLSRAQLIADADQGPRLPTPIEISAGYPASLITVLAMVSESADDHEFINWQKRLVNDESSGTSVFQQRQHSRWLDVEALITDWQPPTLFLSDKEQLLAVYNSWETIRRAAYILHWRQSGFRTDMNKPVRADRAKRRDIYVNEILFNVAHLLHLRRTKGYNIANAMLFPLAVAGMECSCVHLDLRTQVSEMLEHLRGLFSMAHVVQLDAALHELWRRCDAFSSGLFVTDTDASLEACAKDLKIIMPLV